jgi:hypothetical protein
VDGEFKVVALNNGGELVPILFLSHSNRLLTCQIHVSEVNNRSNAATTQIVAAVSLWHTYFEARHTRLSNHEFRYVRSLNTEAGPAEILPLPTHADLHGSISDSI